MICRECGRDLVIEEFYVDNSRPRGHVSRCKKCYSVKQKKDRLGPHKRYSESKYNATRRGIKWDFSFEQYVEFIWMADCFYCGERNSTGIDRLNNELYYDSSNSVACCGKCNAMKSHLTLSNFLNHVKKISLNLDLTIDSSMTANAAIALNGLSLNG